MKQAFLFLKFLIISICSLCQTYLKDPISVNVEVIQKGRFKTDGTNCNNCYLARIEVVNNEDTTLPVTVWSCAWDWNLSSNNNSIKIPGKICTQNVVIEERIPSKKSLVFYSNIQVKQVNNDSFKMGFTNFLEKFEKLDLGWLKNEDLESYNKRIAILTSGAPRGKTYWSKEIIINDCCNSYYFIK